MMRILNRLAQVFHQAPPAPSPSVQVMQDGLQVVRSGETLASLRWSDVRKIITYKYDLFSIDEICVGFLTAPDADSWLEISEQWSGFVEATDKMKELFPSIPKDWYGKVMVPAFERKETVLWEGS